MRFLFITSIAIGLLNLLGGVAASVADNAAAADQVGTTMVVKRKEILLMTCYCCHR
jgi:hypothetical protein